MEGAILPSEQALLALRSHLAQKADGDYWEGSAGSPTTGFIRTRDGAQASPDVYNTAMAVLKSLNFSLLTVLGNRRGQFTLLLVK